MTSDRDREKEVRRDYQKKIDQLEEKKTDRTQTGKVHKPNQYYTPATPRRPKE
jgi:hypothetical protein